MFVILLKMLRIRFYCQLLWISNCISPDKCYSILSGTCHVRCGHLLRIKWARKVRLNHIFSPFSGNMFRIRFSSKPKLQYCSSSFHCICHFWKLLILSCCIKFLFYYDKFAHSCRYSLINNVFLLRTSFFTLVSYIFTLGLEIFLLAFIIN